MKRSLLLALTLLAAPVALAGFDADGNGLSDVFEYIYFHGAADPAADPDGDGLSNQDEMRWGANPTNALSSITAASARVEDTDFVLNWPGVAEKWYRLQVTPDFRTWTNVIEGQFRTFREPLASDGLRFWRVEVISKTPDTDGNGFDDWEEDLWKSTYGKPLSQSDLDGDGLPDAEEFTGGHSPEQKDHPAVSLVVFTPLER